MTLQAICDLLNDEGIPTARGGRLWRPTSLRAVFALIDDARPKLDIFAMTTRLAFASTVTPTLAPAP